MSVPYNINVAPYYTARLYEAPLLLRDVYDIYESSYRVMGGDLGGGEQRAEGH